MSEAKANSAVRWQSAELDLIYPTVRRRSRRLCTGRRNRSGFFNQ
jgi:hypothetical protein